jgi:hypothetical protein
MRIKRILTGGSTPACIHVFARLTKLRFVLTLLRGGLAGQKSCSYYQSTKTGTSDGGRM